MNEPSSPVCTILRVQKSPGIRHLIGVFSLVWASKALGEAYGRLRRRDMGVWTPDRDVMHLTAPDAVDLGHQLLAADDDALVEVCSAYECISELLWEASTPFPAQLDIAPARNKAIVGDWDSIAASLLHREDGGAAHAYTL